MRFDFSWRVENFIQSDELHISSPKFLNGAYLWYSAAGLNTYYQDCQVPLTPRLLAGSFMSQFDPILAWGPLDTVVYQSLEYICPNVPDIIPSRV